jgi:hypothetical protein
MQILPMCPLLAVPQHVSFFQSKNLALPDNDRTLPDNFNYIQTERCLCGLGILPIPPRTIILLSIQLQLEKLPGKTKGAEIQFGLLSGIYA